MFFFEMKIVRRSLLHVSLFTMTVLLYEVSNRVRESCVGIMRGQHNIQTLLIEVSLFIYEICKTCSATIIHNKRFVLRVFQSRAGILRQNHALAKHPNLSLRSFIHSYTKVVRRSLLSLFIVNVLFYEISNRVRKSCVGIMRSQHNIQTFSIEVLFIHI